MDQIDVDWQAAKSGLRNWVAAQRVALIACGVCFVLGLVAGQIL